MLSDAKLLFEQKIYQILFNAYMTQFTSSPEAMGCNNAAQKIVTVAADKFASKASNPVAEAIYKFIKEIGIQINTSGIIISPPMPPSMPGGPCTGIIPVNNITIL